VRHIVKESFITKRTFHRKLVW
jgi:hypothetical protein